MLRRVALPLVSRRWRMQAFNSSNSSSSPSRALSTAATASAKTALVLGSSGALGSSVSRYLSREMGYQVIGADIVELPSDLSDNWELDAFLPMPEPATVTDLSVALYEGVQRVLEESTTDSEGLLDVIVCANGGWQGDPPKVKDPVQAGDMGHYVHDTASVLQHMMQVNLHPVLAMASACVPHLCAFNALVVVMGATAALQPTPGMMGYGVSKAATHHVVQTLGALSTQSLAKTGKGNKSPFYPTVVGILPTTLDTPGNRRAMPEADVSQWTHPVDISKQIGVWLTQPSLRPSAGSLVKVHPQNGQAVFELVR